MPLFYIHTILGWRSFFTADQMKCRMGYNGEILYVIIFMFAVSMCFVFALLFLCVLLPTWCTDRRRRMQRRDFEARFTRLNNDLTDPDLSSESFLNHDFEARE